MKIAIGCDHGAYVLKNKVADHLRKAGYEVADFGTNGPESCDYPDFAAAAARAVASGECEGHRTVHHRHRRFHCRQQGKRHPLRPAVRHSLRQNDPAAQRHQHDGPGRRHCGRESGSGDRGHLALHPLLRRTPPPAPHRQGHGPGAGIKQKSQPASTFEAGCVYL